MKNWKELLYPYEQSVAELETKFKGIMHEYQRLNMYSPIEEVYGRVKKISSILEKATKKSIPMDEIENKIEDIAGIRILCRFVEDIAKIILIIRQRNDMVIVDERDYVTNNKESGYRSYHVIIQYPFNSVMGTKEIFAEIQIRTLAMNFWATAEHSLKYKYDGNIPEDIRDRLIHCAEAAHNLDNEMATIRDEIMEARKNVQIRNDLVEDILEYLQKLHFVAKMDEMDQLNKQFINLWQEGSIEELKDFSKQLSIMAELYRV